MFPLVDLLVTTENMNAERLRPGHHSDQIASACASVFLPPSVPCAHSMYCLCQSILPLPLFSKPDTVSVLSRNSSKLKLGFASLASQTTQMESKLSQTHQRAESKEEGEIKEEDELKVSMRVSMRGEDGRRNL